jgi:UDP-glucose 4-epimerase
VFNVGGNEEISIFALAELVIDTLHSTSSIVFVPYDDAYAPGFEDLRHGRPALERLRAMTGFVPSTPLRSIIECTAEHMFSPNLNP